MLLRFSIYSQAFPNNLGEPKKESEAIMEGEVRRNKGPAEKRSRRAPGENENRVSEATELTASAPAAAPAKLTTGRKRAAATPAKKSSRTRSGPSFEQIQLRAYFIGERRHQLGQPGNETSDWVEAERELRREQKK
jgi:Protein of unknown function (DUF2934)